MSFFQIILLFSSDPRILGGGGLFLSYLLSAFPTDTASVPFFCSSGSSSLILDELVPRPILLQAQGQDSHWSQNQQNHMSTCSSPPTPRGLTKLKYLTTSLWNQSTVKVKTMRSKREICLWTTIPFLQIITPSVVMIPMMTCIYMSYNHIYMSYLYPVVIYVQCFF